LRFFVLGYQFGGYKTSIVNIVYDIAEGAKGIIVLPDIKGKFKRKQKFLQKINNRDHERSNTTNSHTDRFDIETMSSSDELLGLCYTLSYGVESIYTQTIDKPNPKYFIGKGKVQEIAEFITNHGQLEFAVFDCALKPNQIFNLENRFHIRVLDRNALILMIFLHHARTNEAKLQVEYAILKHQIPYLTELVRRSKLGEHPGLLAGGEYKVDEYFKLTKRRIRKIRNELLKIKTSREQRRKHRRRSGFTLITLAGYTNAGKSALLRALTGAQVLVDGRMFSTVGTKTMRYRNSRVLLTDTVGFLRNIPTQLIEAFKSTLEEIIDADHIILIVDISEEPKVIKEKLVTCVGTIDQLITDRFTVPKKGIKNSDNISFTRPIIHLVFNKCDLIANEKDKVSEILKEMGPDLASRGISSIFLISCETKVGLNSLINGIIR